jgi:colicin import membrane protein
MNDFHPDKRPFQRPPRRFLSFILTVAVHIGLLAFLFFGVNWQNKPLGSLEVGLVSAPSAPSAPAPTPPAPPPEPPKPEPPKPEPPPPPPPKPEPKPEIATKAPEPPKPEKKPEPKPKEQPLKPIDLQKQLEEKLTKEIERRDEAKRVGELLDGPRGQSRPGNSGELDAYRSAIARKVRSNLIAPPGLSGNPSAVFEIEQIMGSQGGTVVSVKLKQSSGNHALDEAIERAIRRADPLPPPDDPALFRRRLEITFRPLEE